MFRLQKPFLWVTLLLDAWAVACIVGLLLLFADGWPASALSGMAHN